MRKEMRKMKIIKYDKEKRDVLKNENIMETNSDQKKRKFKIKQRQNKGKKMKEIVKETEVFRYKTCNYQINSINMGIGKKNKKKKQE